MTAPTKVHVGANTFRTDAERFADRLGCSLIPDYHPAHCGAWTVYHMTTTPQVFRDVPARARCKRCERYNWYQPTIHDLPPKTSAEAYRATCVEMTLTLFAELYGVVRAPHRLPDATVLPDVLARRRARERGVISWEILAQEAQ